MKNIFKGISFSEEEKIYECMKTKEDFPRRFHWLLQVFEKGFLQKVSNFEGKEWPIKTG